MEIHKFEFNGKRLVLDVPTSHCFEVDEVMYDLLDHINTHSAEEVVELLNSQYPRDILVEALSELATFKEQGLLCDDALRLDPAPQQSISSLTLNVAHDCNLRCVYCFAGQGPYGGRVSRMDKATARHAIDVLFELSGEQESCHITFFGGEPLLNFSVIQFAIEYATQQAARCSKQVSFSITTNGTLLSKRVVAFFAQHQVGITVSIDGPKDVQDKLRCYASAAKSSYDLVAERVKTLRQIYHRRLTARATVTHANPDIKTICNHLETMGFDRVFCIPVSTDDETLALSSSDIQKIGEAYEQLAAELPKAAHDRQPFGYHGFSRCLARIHRAERRAYACGVGRSMMTVTPEGDIYPCHRFVGMEAFQLGNIFEPFDLIQANKQFVETTVSQRKECASCWARYLCGGHCLHDVAQEDGSFGWPNPRHCSLYRKEIELALYLYASLQENKQAAEMELEVGTELQRGLSERQGDEATCITPPV